METTEIDNGRNTLVNSKNFNPKVGVIIGATAGLLMLGGVAYALTPSGNLIKVDENAPKGEGLEKYLENLMAEDNIASGGGGNNVSEIQGKFFNIYTAPHAHNVNDSMSFDEAFASARGELGAGGVFEWRGQLYGTFYATEVDTKGNPIIDYNKVPNPGYQPSVTDNRFTNPDALDEDIKDEFAEIMEAPTEIVAKAGIVEIDSVERSIQNDNNPEHENNTVQQTPPEINNDSENQIPDMPQDMACTEDTSLNNFDDFA